MTDNNQKLLSESYITLKALEKAKEIYADRIAPDFLFFDFLRDDEYALSRCLENLLDTKGTHAQGDIFLKLFLEQFVKFDWARNLEFKKIYLEKLTTAVRRIDIYIQFEGGEIIAIENKPWAGDQREQLKHYAEFIDQQSFKNDWHLIYLCNHEPTEESLPKITREELVDKGKYSTLPYRNLISWLEKCHQQAKAPIIEIFIKELIRFIREEVNGELDMSDQKEMSQLIVKTPENLHSAFQIYRSLDTVKEQLLVEFKSSLEQKIQAAGFELMWDEAMTTGWKSYSGFSIRFRTNHNFYLRFEFNAEGLQELLWGICRSSNSISKNPTLWSQINEMMDTKFPKGRTSKWWPWWSWINDSTDLAKEVSDWSYYSEPWEMIVNDQLAPKLVELSNQVWSVFESNESLLIVPLKSQ